MHELTGDSGRDEAYQSYRHALDLDFSFTYALIRLGILAIETQNLPDAMRYLELAMTRTISSETRADIYAWLAKARLIQADIPNAEIHLQQALQLSPSHRMALKIKAWLYNHQGKARKAIALLNSIIAQAPEDKYVVDAPHPNCL